MEIKNRIIRARKQNQLYVMSSENKSDSLLNLLILLVLLILLDLVDLPSLPLNPSSVMHVSLLTKVWGPMKLLLISRLLLNCSWCSLTDSWRSLSWTWRLRLDPKLNLDFLPTSCLIISCSWLTRKKLIDECRGNVLVANRVFNANGQHTQTS